MRTKWTPKLTVIICILLVLFVGMAKVHAKSACELSKLRFTKEASGNSSSSESAALALMQATLRVGSGAGARLRMSPRSMMLGIGAEFDDYRGPSFSG